MARTLGDLARQFDERFAVHQFIELTNWEFALSGPEREALLARGGEIFRSTFNGWLNGKERQPVDRVYLAVFPEQSLLWQIAHDEELRGSPGALILTHHPCDMETSNRGFLPIPDCTLDLL